jgi:hypothetical protein
MDEETWQRNALLLWERDLQARRRARVSFHALTLTLCAMVCIPLLLAVLWSVAH